MKALIGLAFLTAMGSAWAAPSAPRPFTQNSSGLTQNNTSGLSQNLRSRTGTETSTNTIVSPRTIGTGFKQPVPPTPLVIGARPPAPNRVAPTATPAAPATSGNLPSNVQGAPATQPTFQAPALSGSGGSVTETPGNE